MTIQEILEKEVFNIEDIQVIFQCGKSTGYKIIRDIKAISNRVKLSGRVHKKDYEDYINRLSK